MSHRDTDVTARESLDRKMMTRCIAVAVRSDQLDGIALGERIVVSGRVLDEDGRPLRNTLVEVVRRMRAVELPDGIEREIIVVDDGIATGASMLAAVRALRASSPESIVVAVPVGPQSVSKLLAQEADDVVCATMPNDFEAVGQVFVDFHQVSDDEVRDLLATPTSVD